MYVVKPQDIIMARIALSDPFQSLRLPHYRWFAIGTLCFHAALQTQVIARGWLVYEKTSSPFALGLVTSAWFLSGALFSLPGGVIADRVSKTRIMIITESFLAVTSLLIALLIVFDVVQLWQLVLTSVLGGAAFGLNVPARQSLIPSLVSRDKLLNAFALNTAGFNLMQVVAPSVAAFAVAFFGVAGAYFFTMALFGFAMVTRLFIPVSESKNGTAAGTSWMRDFGSGISYVRRNQVVLCLLLMSLSVTILAMPYTFLLPVFAKDVLGGNVALLGWLTSASGVGALAASLWVAGRTSEASGKALLASVFLTGLFLVFLSVSHNLTLSMLSLLGAGAAFTVFCALGVAAILVRINEQMRGRVIAMLMIGPGLMPLGIMPLSGVAEKIGPSIAFGVEGAALMLLTVALAIAMPRLREI